MLGPLQDVSELVTSIEGDAPEVTATERPSILGDTSHNTSPSLENTSTGDLDSAGTPWDASLHSASKAKKADGTWKGRTGRKAGQGSASKVGTPKQAAPVQAAPSGPAPHTAEAAAIVGIVTGAHVAVFGPDWLPNADEALALTEATRAFAESQGGIPVPPWLALAGAYLAIYAAPRFRSEGTKKRIAGITGAVRAWFKKRADRAKEAQAQARAAKAETASVSVRPQFVPPAAVERMI